MSVTTEENISSSSMSINIQLPPIKTEKIAPRAKSLFRVGPQFSQTQLHQEMYCDNDQEVYPILESRIDRGFEMGEDGMWIGYKRNYFTLAAAFHMHGFSTDEFLNKRFFIKSRIIKEEDPDDNIKSQRSKRKSRRNNGKDSKEDKDEMDIEISYFAIRLAAKCNDDDFNVSLIQHTAKRDKGPQFPPPIYPSLPGDLPNHEVITASCNKKNDSKLASFNKIFLFDREEYYSEKGISPSKDPTTLKNYPSQLIAKVSRFERIQFASSIRAKRKLHTNRYYSLCVELLGIIDDGTTIQPVLLASIDSPPLIIRGRSPSSYPVNRTSGYRLVGKENSKENNEENSKGTKKKSVKSA